MWYGHFIVSKVLEKGAYELVDYDGIPFGKPRNGLCLKRYYAYITHVWYLVYMYIFYLQCVLVFSIWFEFSVYTIYTMFWLCRSDGLVYLR